MPAKRLRLPHTFPHKIVFIISLVLCVCACGSIVAAVIAWSNYLWGYYIGTGFWSGAVILLAGMFGIVASYVRSICAVKTFMIISIFGCLASLGMIALAAGGLDPESGFYDGFNKTTFMTHIVHAVYLGLGVLQITLCVLSDGICIYYLFIERNAELYCAKSDDHKKRKKKQGNIRRGKDRSSTGSQVPLVGDSKTSKRKSKDGSITVSEPVDANTEGNEVFPIPYTAAGLLDRETLLRQEILMSKVSPLRTTPYTRSASFSTFGRIGGPDRESLIVHPTDDNSSVAETITTSPQSLDDECHYAQTMLFGPPLPIEEDEVLPPYEVIDNTPLRNKPRRGLKRPKSEELNVSGRQSRRPNSVQERQKRNSSKRSRSSQAKAKIPHGRNDSSFESGSLKRPSSKRSVNESAVLRLSKSADLLAFEDESKDSRSPPSNFGLHEQGVASRDFTHSSEMVRVLGQAVQLRHKRPQSQTMKVNRDNRLDRRRKALSAEVKLNKYKSSSQEGMFRDEADLEHRFSSIDGSNPNLFAGNRILSTKFSLRTRTRQVGMPPFCAPVPVKPIVSVPTLGPPKPPRNYSVTADDLKDLELDTDGEVEPVFTGINGVTNTVNDDDDVFATENQYVLKINNDEKHLNDNDQKPGNIAVVQASRTFSPEKSIEAESKLLPENASFETTSVVPLSPEVKLDSGPVVKFVPPNSQTKPPLDDVDGTENRDKLKGNSFVSIDKTKDAHTRTMVLPTSPILRPPPVIFSYVNKANNVVKSNQNHSCGDEKNNSKNTNKKFTKPNNIEVVYAKVVKENSTSPVSPVSPISPTSPSAKIQKAKRLTYTIKDKNVSVFDPIGNTKETEEISEVVESISVKRPVESQTDKQQVERHKEHVARENHVKNEPGPNVIVRMPPLSPSEKILQRIASKSEKRDISPSKEDRPVILQPANAFKDFNRKSYGARPKTSHTGLFAPLSPSKQSHGHESNVKQMETGKQFTNVSTNNAFNLSESHDFTKHQPSNNTPRSTSLPPILPKPSNRPSSTFNNTYQSVPNNSVQLMSQANSSNVKTAPTVVTTAPAVVTRDVPVNRVQAIPVAQSVSQGVLHLPQYQHSRQMAGNALSPALARDIQDEIGASPQHLNALPQNNAQQNNDQTKSLFSVVL